MNFPRQAHWWLVFFSAGQLAVFPLPAQDSPAVSKQVKLFSAPANNLPPVVGKSPVDLFRQLLAMTSDEREVLLTNRTPEIRARLLVKVAEYEALNPDERELRLRATELRWYLLPLLRASPPNRAARLAQVPDNLRELVQNRLQEWIILPPPLQQEFLENERTLGYFTHMDISNSPAENSGRQPAVTDRARWDALSENDRRFVTAQFNQFFELTPAEKQKTLNTLSDAERQQMQKTLQSFDKMPPSQRTECINAFGKFASMDTSQQAEFLKNAERWSEMSPTERQAWRDLVVNVPQWPPLPIGFLPPSPPTPPATAPAVATNHN
jgi:Protein of unknown function (DUF3106)